MNTSQQSLRAATSVRLPVDAEWLHGDFGWPQDPKGLVVFAHGSGSSRHSPRNRYVAEALQERGLGTLLMDLLTAREEREDLVTGHLRFDIALLAERLTAAIDPV